MLLLPVLTFVLAPVLIILLPAPLLEALLHKSLYTPVCVSVPIPLLLSTVFFASAACAPAYSLARTFAGGTPTYTCDCACATSTLSCPCA